MQLCACFFPFRLPRGICAVAALLCRLPFRFPRGFAQSLRFFAGYLPAFRAGISHAERDFSPPACRGGPCKAFEAHGLTALGFFRTSPYRSELLTSLYGKSPALRAELQMLCGERGIRTPDTLLEYTRFPGVPLKPLEHLSKGGGKDKKYFLNNLEYQATPV